MTMFGSKLILDVVANQLPPAVEGHSRNLFDDVKGDWRSGLRYKSDHTNINLGNRDVVRHSQFKYSDKSTACSFLLWVLAQRPFLE